MPRKKQKIVYVARSCVVSWSKGMNRLVKGDAWDGQADLVKERPDLFSRQPLKLRGSKVERATNRPGERRGGPPPAEPSPPVDPPADPAGDTDGNGTDSNGSVEPPPMTGKGSGVEAWREFASKTTDSPAESFAALNRNQIVELLVAEGVLADPSAGEGDDGTDGDEPGADDPGDDAGTGAEDDEAEAGELAAAK